MATTMPSAAELVFLQSAIDEEMRKKKMRTGLKTWHQTPFNPSIYRRNEGRFYGEIKHRPRDFLWRVSQVGVGVIDQNTARTFDEAKKAANLSINMAYRGLSASMGAGPRWEPGYRAGNYRKIHGDERANIYTIGPAGYPPLFVWSVHRGDEILETGRARSLSTAKRAAEVSLGVRKHGRHGMRGLLKAGIGALESRNPLLEKQWASKEPVPSFTYDTRYGVVEPIHWYANPTKIEILSGHDDMDDADEELSEMQASGFGKGWW